MPDLKLSALALCLAFQAAFAQAASTVTIRLDGKTAMTPVNAAVHSEVFLGRSSLKVTDTAPPDTDDGGRLVILPGVAFKDGEIQLDVAGQTAANAAPDARGFVGVAFRASAQAERFEYVYVRPTNGRADDQARRNHSVQYAAHPDYGWKTLRDNAPARYEAYADMEAAQWIHLRISVAGSKARVFINNAAQPTLIVNDLKLGAQGGVLGLWIGPGSIAHFANLRVTDSH